MNNYAIADSLSYLLITNIAFLYLRWHPGINVVILNQINIL